MLSRNLHKVQNTAKDWDPGAYDRFRDLRLGPALDLLGSVGKLPPGDVVDLGCGSGAVGPALQSRWPDRRIIGVDSSEAMLSKAADTQTYAALEKADAGKWEPDRRPALIFSNALLHWLPDHGALLPRLVRFLANGGWLAMQVPGQNDMPSHATWRALTGNAGEAGIETPARYLEILEPLGQARVWETQYYQTLPPDPLVHPVRAFTSSTYGKPFLEATEDRYALETAYDARMERAYPRRSNGTVVFPFRRVFCVVQKT